MGSIEFAEKAINKIIKNTAVPMLRISLEENESSLFESKVGGYYSTVQPPDYLTYYPGFRDNIKDTDRNYHKYIEKIDINTDESDALPALRFAIAVLGAYCSFRPRQASLLGAQLRFKSNSSLDIAKQHSF